MQPLPTTKAFFKETINDITSLSSLKLTLYSSDAPPSVLTIDFNTSEEIAALTDRQLHAIVIKEVETCSIPSLPYIAKLKKLASLPPTDPSFIKYASLQRRRYRKSVSKGALNTLFQAIKAGSRLIDSATLEKRTIEVVFHSSFFGKRSVTLTEKF